MSGCSVSLSGKEKCSNWYPGLQGSHFNTLIICLCICSKSERCFCCHRCFAVLSTKECCHVFHSRQKWKQQVLQNPFFLSLDWAWLLPSFFSERADFSAIVQKLRSSPVYTGHNGNLELGFPAVPSALELIFPPHSPTAFYRHHSDGNTATYFQIHYLSMIASGIPVPGDMNCLQSFEDSKTLNE